MTPEQHHKGGVLCVGRLYCDLVFTGIPHLPEMGHEVFAGGLQIHAGGGGFITGATLAALGWKTSLAATLPAPPFDTPVLDQLTSSGIESSRCTPAAPGDDPQVTVAMSDGKDRAFLTRASGAAFSPLSVDDFTGFTHLHIGELRTLTEHPELLELGRNAGLSLSLDCSWDNTLPENAAELIASVDVFLPNENEARRLEKEGVSNNAPLTVIKCGAAGAYAITQNGSRAEAPGQNAKVCDTTGAGDAFNGGFLHKWLAGASLSTSLECANACGAATVAGIGGTGGLKSIRQSPWAGVCNG